MVTLRAQRAAMAAAAAAMLAVGFAADAQAQERRCLSPRTRMIGAERAVIKDWPGQAALRYQKLDGSHVYFCGGAAIAPQWILTAAHCITPGTADNPRIEVAIGAEDLLKAKASQIYEVERAIVHETYQEALDRGVDPGVVAIEIGYDIALLKLTGRYDGPLAEISWSRDTDPDIASQVRVAGFGVTQAGAYGSDYEDLQSGVFINAGSPTLLEATVSVIGESACRTAWSNDAIGGRQICAGIDSGPDRGSCQGDSGGPMVGYSHGCPVQVGVVSYGDVQCGVAGSPSVFTRVSAFADWIRGHTGPLTQTANRLDDPDKASLQQRAEMVRHLESLLGAAEDNLSLRIGEGETRFKLGDLVRFTVEPQVDGRLILVDINAEGAATLIFPNEFVRSAEVKEIAAGESVTIPNADYGFTDFEAQPPVGRNRLIAILVPEDFDLARIDTLGFSATRGFQPVNKPVRTFGELVKMIEDKVGRDPAPSKVRNWGLAILDYEIAE